MRVFQPIKVRLAADGTTSYGRALRQNKTQLCRMCANRGGGPGRVAEGGLWRLRMQLAVEEGRRLRRMLRGWGIEVGLVAGRVALAGRVGVGGGGLEPTC